MADPPDSGSVESAAERIAKQMAGPDVGGLGGSAAERIAKQMAGPDIGGLGGSAAERIAKQMAGLDIGGLGGSAVERMAKQIAESGIAGGAAKTYDNFAKKLAESGIGSEASKTHDRIAKQLAGLGIDDDLRTAFGRTADLTSSLGDSLAYLRASSLPGLEFAAAKMPDLTVPRNPIFDTNEELAELSRTTRDLVGIAQQQAELSQSLAETSRLALSETIRSGKQAKFATWLAAAGIVATVIIAIATMYYNYRQSQTAEAHLQYEIQVLHEISREQRAAAGRHQDEVRALGEILHALQNPKNATPSNARSRPKAPPTKE